MNGEARPAAPAGPQPRPMSLAARMSLGFAMAGVLSWILTCPAKLYFIFPLPAACGLLAMICGLVAIRTIRANPGLRGASQTAAGVVFGMIELGLVFVFVVLATREEITVRQLLDPGFGRFWF